MDDVRTPPPMPGPQTGPGARLFAGRFRAERCLKDGAGIRTWEGTDTAGGAAVIIKTAAAADVPESVRRRLAHEAQVLGELRAGDAAAVLAFGAEDGLLYLVLPRVPGITLAARLAAGPPAPREALAVAESILSALAEAHARGVIHRDLKPANVIVDAEGPVRRAVLIDFGLARSERLHESIRDLPAGTALYLSPEQAGLLPGGVDARSDLYSLGVLLFECLAGRPPFTGRTIGEVLREHVAARPPGLRELGVPVPRAADEIVQRLLRKDPRDRYQSAESALADVRALAAGLDAGQAEPVIAVGAHDRRRTLTEPAFVGRAAELEALDAELAAAGHGRGGLVLLEAESGGGKTRLLDELARRFLRRGGRVFRGQGVDQAAQNPFQVLEGVARDLAADPDPAAADELRRLLGEQRDAVVAAVPQLAGVLGAAAEGSLGPEAFGEARSLAALAALLDALGRPGRPALILLDDCQWADELTLKLLAHRQAHPAPAERHVLVAAAFRTEEVPEGHRLRSLPRAVRIALPPMPARDVRDIVESMAGPLPDEAVDTVARLCEGSPFMAAAVLRGLTESGALAADAGGAGWRVDPRALADVSASRRAAAVLGRRIDLLPADAVRLLGVGAVLGKEFDLDLAAALAGCTLEQAAAALEEARRRHIVWADARGVRRTFVHDKLREALLARMSADQRRALHLAAARQIESADPQRIFDLAYHFDAAGESGRALPYALAAAERARARHSLEIAERQYRIAGRGASGPEHERAIAQGLGEVLMLRGRYPEAEDQLRKAFAAAADDLSRSKITGKLAELAFKRGDVRTAGEFAEDGLRLLGRRVPRTFVTLLVAALWQVLVQVVHTWLPRRLWARRRPPTDAVDAADRLAACHYSRLAHVYWFQRGAAWCLWAHLRGLNLAERGPDGPELAQACSEHAPVMTMLPFFSRGIRYAERSLAIRQALGDVWGQGQSLHFYGIVLYGASRYEESIAKLNEAVRLLERTGDRWEVNTARWHIAFCRYRLGDLRSAVELARQVYHDGAEIGDAQAMGISLGVWSKASGGRVPEDLIRRQLARPGDDAHTRAEILQAEGVRLLGLDRSAEAAEVLESALRLVRAAGLRQEYVSPIRPWLAGALRREAEKVPATAPALREALLARARAAARGGLRTAKRFRNNLPHALRECGLLAAMSGRPGRARRLLDRSLAEADRQGAKFERALTLAARAQVGAPLGWPGAEADAAAARQALSAGGLSAEPESDARPVTLSLAERFSSVLDAGRRIAGSLSRDSVFSAATDAAMLLLGGEDCVIVDAAAPADSPAAPVFGGRSVSRSAVRRAVAAGKPIVVSEAPAGDVGESLVLSGARSTLCAPIFVRNRAVHCLYVTHGQVGGLFGEDELRLAEFITALAGAALENAEGFEEIKALSGQNERLYRDAQAANRVKDEFLATLSHELRTPLNAVIGWAHLLRSGDLKPSEFGHAIEVIERNAKSQAELLKDLLDVSRIVSGKLRLELRPLALVPVIEAAVDAVRPAAQAKGVELDWSPGPAVGPVLGDAGRLQQIVWNLLSNAVKFTPAGGHVAVRTAKVGGAAEIRVRDDGIGIPADFLPHMFERFRQADSSTTRKYGGLGLGLAIVRHLAELHGGSARVKSEGPGRGAEFTVTLPLPVSAAGAPEPAEAAEPAARRGVQLNGVRVLVVDDDPDARDLVAALLAGCGARVTAVASASAAYEELDRLAPDVILSDIGMPDEDGLALIRRVRTHGATRRIPAAALTAFAGESDRRLALSAGYDDHIPKPIDPSRLAAVVADLSGRSAKA